MSGILGCGSYRAYIQTRGGADVLVELPWETLGFSRKLNEISDGSVTVGQAGIHDEECCWALSTLNAWEHELAIWRDDVLVWVGVVGDPTYTMAGTTAPARDLFSWFERRFLPGDRTFRAEDLGTIFSTMATDALAADNGMGITLTVSSVGVIGNRDVFAADRPRAADEMRELSRSAVDWTMIARELKAGGEEVPTADLGTFIDDNLLDPSLTIRGSLAATSIAVIGASSGAAHNPVVGTAGVGVDPDLGLVETSYSESNILDANSARYAAEAKYEQLRVPPLYLDATLDPDTGVGFDELIPGARVDVVADIGCKRVNQGFRLLAVAVTAAVSDSGETEQVRVTLVPAGTTALGS